MSIFKQEHQLTAGPRAALRRDALAIVGGGVSAVIPDRRTRCLVSVDNQTITVGGDRYDIAPATRIYVIGVGKGSFPIAQALDQQLGCRIHKGLVIVKEGETRRLPHIDVLESSHPIPDSRSVDAAKALAALLGDTRSEDLVFAALTGGSSAMVNLPPDGVSIEDLALTNDLLLRSGAPIGDMNTVRRHLCLLKGGRLARLAHPARIVTLTLDTAPPGLPWPDLTAPDPTTFTDAVQVLQRYDLWTSVPRSVQRYLSRNVGRTEQETCVSLNGVCYRTYSVGSPADACQAAALCAQKLGYTPAVLSSSFSGEARELGIFLAGLCNEITRNSQPFSPPCALISGGETTVTFEKGRLFGQGGPNQETALAFARAVASGFPAVLVSLDTDGTDGPGQWAGGIVDDQTALAAAACGIDLDQVLSRHDAANALQSLNGAIVTGHTGTNVMNLRVLLIGAPPSHRQEA